jgi:hypothetical protein
MKTLMAKIVPVAAALLLTNAVSAAGFVHIDGVEGESKQEAATKEVRQPQKKPEPQPAREIDSGQAAQPPGSSLPAVQKAPEAAGDKSKKKGKAETNFKVEEGES